eukprot:TRINITY_DN14320_c0_g1_i1.p1 TRINITY_DN14320_c0_g1~~TRINITY_DN14320_c0_g1_i1.p1  ORF type:complete len:278 (+),score=58.04 TRINITY_DN14320_c0_g1_i1:119-952(+)
MGEYGACDKLSQQQPRGGRGAADQLLHAPQQAADAVAADGGARQRARIVPGCGESPGAASLLSASWRLILRPGEPFFLENPDGTIAEGLRTTGDPQRSARKQDETGEGDESDGNLSEVAARTLSEELEYLLCMHEYGFMAVLFLQLTLEMLYNVIYVLRMDSSVTELSATYDHKLEPWAALLILRVVYIAHLVYDFVYYFLAYYAVYSRKPREYQRFYTWAMLGIASLVLFTYVGKFNLPLFLLRTCAYVYGRYMQGLSTSRVLLPMLTHRATADAP